MRQFNIGDIVFERGKTPISVLIKWIDKGEFSHVGVILSKEGHLLEAQYGTHLRIVPFYFKDYEIVSMNFSEEERSKILRIGIELVGKHYDYSQIFGYLLRYLFGFKDIQRFNSPNNMICSEVIDYILYSLGKIPKEIYIGGHTPNELYKFLKNDYLKLL